MQTRCYGPSLPYTCNDHQLGTASLTLSDVVGRVGEAESLSLNSFTACEPDSERTESFMIRFSTDARQRWINGAPQTDMLLSLVQFNTTRALVINARLLGIASEFMLPEARSRMHRHVVDDAKMHGSIPLSLQPTYLQLTTSHHAWVDILPFPEMRDNILRRNEDSYDKKELCRDLRGFQDVAKGLGGMIIWGEAWDCRAWEVTESFASKWAWVIRDCFQLQESTQYWRSARGEI
ncbi:hypothetical protein Focb16_v008150 [Fusarium oxysporum f. sp. cubense]|uniref:Uncharacterized protein n=1 Tax=Fusarium oxysporum f. sp. cubense TaxID=61366 RepID=A0A559LSS9_FUSOC|nr:hypothetical protein Focb16_v008150 [Fusarium oxysporum f. sp. cubense]